MLTVILLVATALLIGIDQLTKWLAITQLHNADRIIPIIDGVFEFRYLENRGAAFGIFKEQMWFLIPITVIISALFMIMLIRSPLRRQWMFSTPTVLIFAGAIGTLIDRIIYGYVVDFLYFKLIDFPIFNFADCCVVIGSILFFIYFLFIQKEDIPLSTMFLGIRTKKEEKDDG